MMLASAPTVTAQDTIPSGGKLEFTRTTPEVAEILKRSRPVENRAIPVPKFVVKSQNNNFIMTIGGMITPVMGYDIGNNLYKQPGAGISFVTSAIPVPAQAGHKGDFYINPINGSVDLQVVGLANTPNEITGYVLWPRAWRKPICPTWCAWVLSGSLARS